MLERISASPPRRPRTLIAQLEADVTHESAMKIKEIEAHYKEEADTIARELISGAIQRCAADRVAPRPSPWCPCPTMR